MGLKQQQKKGTLLAPNVLGFVLLSILLLAARAKEETTTAEEQQQHECKESDAFTEDVDLTFIKDKIFTLDKEMPDPFSHLHSESSNEREQSQQEEDNSFGSMFQSVMNILSFNDDTDQQQRQDDSTTATTLLLDNMLDTARKMTLSTEKTRSFEDMLSLFGSAFTQVKESLNRTLDIVWASEKRFHLLSAYYFLEHEDELKNPSWKRRKHRYFPQVDTETILQLHNGLYLSQLSYADTVEIVQDGLKNFMNNTWELVYCQLEGFPKEPAHFMAIQKEVKVEAGYFPWQKGESSLDVMIVVRGTKEIGDVLSDGMLEAQDYRGGKAHAGIAEAGRYLVEKHIETLQHLLEVSGRDKIRLSLVGHSLGAGAAAIAAIEYNEFPMMEASAIGFGCPALLSDDLSEQTKDYITTVVADSDVIPRMSGATFANMLLDIASYDFTAKAMEDLEDFLEFLDSKMGALVDIPIGKIMKWVDDEMERNDRPHFDKVTKERLPRVLQPPGTCIHVFRDGFSYTGSFTPCNFFDTVDVTRTLVDDHMILPGYHRAFLNMLRDRLRDFHFDFEHDIMALPVD